LDLSISIIGFSFGAVLLTSIIATILLFIITMPQLTRYCLYLWSSTFILGITFFCLYQIISNYHSVASLFLDIVLDAQILFYFIFCNAAFGFSKQKTPRVWFLNKFVITAVIVQEIVDIVNHLWGSEGNLLYLALLLLILVLTILMYAYVFYFVMRYQRSGYNTLLVSGGLVLMVSSVLTLVLEIFGKNSHDLIVAHAVFSAGIFCEILLFSMAMGYLFKTNWEEKINRLKDIENLNYISQIQIAELEEKKEMIRMDEQKKLGRELHDALAATVAAIQMQVSREAFKAEAGQLHNRLKNISQELTGVYEVIRNKSHQWYIREQENNKPAFEKRIKAMMDTVLSDNRYNKEIEIEESALSKLSLGAKANILRIVRESMINILQHANAHEVSVIIYEEPDEVVLTITDDGDGMNNTERVYKRDAAFKPVRERVSEMHGKFDIVSTRNGTEITVMLPADMEKN
jgi:signal transduction histidine kinase